MFPLSRLERVRYRNCCHQIKLYLYDHRPFASTLDPSLREVERTGNQSIDVGVRDGNGTP